MKATLSEESSDMLLLLKATVFLNNAGASLLRRGCIRQSIETFSEALAVAKLGCRSNDIKDDILASPSLFTQQHDAVDITTILDKSYHRLSHPKPSTLSNISLEVISDDESTAWIQSRSLQDETESSMEIQGGNFVIHMDHLDVDVPSGEEMTIQCSIISYNYGVAYLYLASLPTSRPFVDKLYMGALQMFQLAAFTLASHHLKKEKLQSHHMHRILITGLFVFRNLIHLSTTLGMATERDKYLQCLNDLKQSIHEFCNFHDAISSPTARAA